jgi:hypothetical protein
MENGMEHAMDEGKPPKPKKAASKVAKKPAPKPYRRPRGGEARAVSDLMPEIGRAAFRRFGFVQSSVVSRWGEIVGSRYAAVSAPESIRFPVGKKADGTLELIVEGAHATMMQHVVPEIIERVNRFFGYTAVARVKMRQGRVTKPSDSQGNAVHKPAIPPSLKPLPMELGESLRDIADPELFTVLESLARSLANNDASEEREGLAKKTD